MCSRHFLRILIFSSIVATASSLTAKGSDDTGELKERPKGSNIARVLECSAPVEINRSDERVASPGMYLTVRDTLTIPAGTQVTLLFQDGAIMEFKGPATVGMQSNSFKERGGFLAELAASLKELLFSEKDIYQDVQLGVRYPNLPAETSLRVPQLLLPIPGTNLLEPPVHLRWQPVEGVFLYSVSLFDRNELLWQRKTKNDFIEIPGTELDLEQGQDYVWIVEAIIGNSSLRSEPAVFSILDKGRLSEFASMISNVDNSSIDSDLAEILKLHVYSDFNLKNECYQQVELILKSRPREYTAQIMKAQLLEDMGLYDRAAEIYKTALLR